MEIKIADTQRDFFSLVRIRSTVFVDEQNVDMYIEQDTQDDIAIHFIAYESDVPVACCRGFIEGKSFHVGRVAVLKEYRKKGYGKALMDFVQEYAKNKGLDALVLDAQVSAIPFYHAIGFHSVGDYFYEANIQHIKMEKNVH